MTDYEADREKKIAVYSALQYYKILSYKTFYKKVLGEKIREKVIGSNDKIISTFKKKESGEIEREIVIDKINNMDNSILIVDEAHNLTTSSSKNEYGKALHHIINKSKNLKVLLLSATPMKNLATDIIDLLNFIRPIDNQIKKDLIFTNEKEVHLIKFKENGKDILRKNAKGYVSYFRGSIPYTFAKRIDKGEIPEELIFTPLIRCYMSKFQLISYKKSRNKNIDIERKDTLFKSSSAAANFIFPILSSDKKNIIGSYASDGNNKLISQINSSRNILIKKINKQIFKNKIKKSDIDNFLYESDKGGIRGSILKLDYLKTFSIKFYKCLNRLNKLNDNDKGAGTAFIYSNLVRAGGMELFAECLKENGYLEYNENFNEYNIQDNTIDAITGKTYSEFKKKKKDLRNFYPATYVLVTGTTDETGEDIPEIKQKQIRNVFNSYKNRNGKYIKFILGTMVMQEGVTLFNVREIHILDVHYNLGKVEQVIGRGIRMCSHKSIINENNKFPEVNVYRYVVSLKNELSTDEILYKKAEVKYLLVKETERVLKEVAVDCPLLLNGNKFPEEIEEYKNCVPPTAENIRKKKKICPALCDFTTCELKCYEDNLNKDLWDKKNKTYNDIKIKDIDYNTFNENLARFEVDNIKNKIKDIFKFKHVYIYEEIENIIKKSYNDHQSKLFDKYFIDQALEDLMPKTENDFNNFRTTVYDKFNKPGYIIQRDKYYIFQPFDENENTPIYYRKNININLKNLVPISNYINNNFNIVEESKNKDISKKNDYDFDSVIEYYDEREENFLVGIIDKNVNKLASGDIDLFKIRPSRDNISDKKRGTGIHTLKGAVCSTSKDKKYLLDILKKLPAYDDKKIKKTRDKICSEIRNRLLFLEKFSLSKNKNKKTYIMIPKNHKKYEFPFNLEDRIKYKIKNINKYLNRNIDVKVKKYKNGIFLDKRDKNYVRYELEFKNSKYVKEKESKIKSLGAVLNDNLWIINVE